MALEAATFLSELVVTNPVGATDPKSEGDNHLRMIKAALKNTFPNFTAAALNATQAQLDGIVGATPTWTSTDAGVNPGPTLTLDRNSASPADNDSLGMLVFQGRNDAAETVVYGRIRSRILDASDGTEDGDILVQAMVNGVLTNIGTFDAAGLAVTGAIAGTTGSFSGALTVGGAFTSLGIDDNATSEVIDIADTVMIISPNAGEIYTIHTDSGTRNLSFSGGPSRDVGSNIHLYGNLHSTSASDILFRVNTNNVYHMDVSANSHTWSNTSASQVMSVSGTGNFTNAGTLVTGGNATINGTLTVTG